MYLILDVAVVWRLSELGVGRQSAVHHDGQQQPEEHLQTPTQLRHQHLKTSFKAVQVYIAHNKHCKVLTEIHG